MILFPYQRQAWRLFDTSRVSIWVASRQVGKSTTLRLWAYDQALAGHDVTWISSSLDICRLQMELLSALVHDIHGIYRHPALSIPIPGGGTIFGKASSARTARGYTGHVILDEADWYADPRGVWRAAKGIATHKGRKVVIASSPWGEGSWLEEMIDKAGDKQGWGVHTTDIYTAIEDGIPIDLAEIKEDFDDDDFAAEYECKFIHLRDSYFNLDLIREAQTDDLRDRGHSYGGIDVGVTGDATVMSRVTAPLKGWFDLLDQDYLSTAKRDGHDGLRVDDQIDIASHWVRREKMRATYIDARGPGRPIADQIETRCPGLVTLIKDRGQRWKEDLAAEVRMLSQRGRLSIPFNRDLLDAFRGVRRRNDGTINSQRSKAGHADRFWSLAYALRAALDYDQSGDPVRQTVKPLARRPKIRA